jgi:hypothetical protein
MRIRTRIFGWIAAAVCLGATMAHAQYEPVIAVSGRAGVPVVIHGFDATGAIVEGDWGLARPDAVAVTVIDPGPLLVPFRPDGAYYPVTGRRPRYGRHEIDTPPRNLPRAESYRRSWASSSSSVPVNIGPVYAAPNLEISPQNDARRERRRRPARRR